MQESFRKALIDSHIAAIVIAILIASSIGAALSALWEPVYDFLFILASDASGDLLNFHLDPAFAFHSVFSSNLSNLSISLAPLLEALVCMFAAYFLSHWAYGVGPLRSLKSYRGKFSRKGN